MKSQELFNQNNSKLKFRTATGMFATFVECIFKSRGIELPEWKSLKIAIWYQTYYFKKYGEDLQFDNIRDMMDGALKAVSLYMGKDIK